MMRTLSALLLLLSSACFAETGQGFYIAGGLMSQQLKTHLQSNEIYDGPPVTIDLSDSYYRQGGTIVAGYQHPFSTNGAIMLEAGTDFSGDSTFSAHAETGPNTLDVNWKVARSWFLAIKPGLHLGEGVVGYLSFAYHSADIDFSRTTVGSQNNTRTGVRAIGGAGVGIGLQGKISERFFVRGEVENIRLSRATFDFTPPGDTSGTIVSVHSIKPEAIVGRVIVGYKF